jgi:deazaflavin-dependent oxidoreductase (nitroreductase family)
METTSRHAKYAQVGPFRRLVRATAATRAVTWVAVRTQQPLDHLVYRTTGGRATLSSWLSGLPVIMLTVTGARTGQRRTVPVVAIPAGAGLIVIASNYGRPHHPAWYHNLRSQPRATVTVNGRTHEVEAHELLGQERDRCFEQAVGMHPGFAIYRTRAANRRITVMRLDPA